jgi:potassium-transporting ATPase ATP-binding subunit
MLITRGALTTFSIANDVAKYFAILPGMFSTALPGLAAFNIMGLATPQSSILSALIFNALIIPALIPLALRGVRVQPTSAEGMFRRNLLVYGAGGLIATRHRRFAFARLSGPYQPGYCADFSRNAHHHRS